MSLETQEPTGSGELTAELITFDSKIHRGNAKRSTDRLLKGLSNLGLQFNQPVKTTIHDLPSGKIEQLGENHFHQTVPMSFWNVDLPRSMVLSFGSELISNSYREIVFSSGYSINASMSFEDQPVRMSLIIEPKGHDPYKLNLVMPTTLSTNKEMLFGDLPPDFASVGFMYDFLSNPQFKDSLSAVARKRIPVEVVSGDLFQKSLVLCQDTPEGINTTIRLNLQNPNPQNRLKCYEVEVFSGGNKNSPNTPQIAPETIWQAEENHYCMVDGKSYPLVPIELDKISKLGMIISYHGDTPQVMFDLLGDLPLSIDWTNQWYASDKAPSEEATNRLELLFKPEWGDKTAALTHRQTSSKRISPKDIHSALISMIAAKTTLSQNLAVA